jgi:replicative DNA helicase
MENWPHDPVAECEVLAAAMDGKSEIVLDTADQSWFAASRYKAIFAAVKHSHETVGHADQLTVYSSLMALGMLEQAGGMSAVTEIAQHIGYSGRVGAYLKILGRHVVARSTIAAGSKIASIGQDDSLQAEDIVEAAEQALLDATRAHVGAGMVSVSDAMASYLERLTAARLAPDGVTGLRTGIAALDQHLGGLQPGWLVEVFSQSKMGKTAFSVGNLAVAAASAGHRVAIFSLEMPEEEVAGRMLATLSGVPSHIQRTNMDPEDLDRFTVACGVLGSLPIKIMGPEALTPSKLRTRARRELLGCSHPLVIVDYLQLMAGDNKRDNSTDVLSKAAQGCKNLARELQATVVLVVQPTGESERETRHAKGRRLSRADMRGGQAIFAAADVVLIPYRHSVSNEDADKREADITLDACRHAEAGTRYPVRWNGARMMFEDEAHCAPRGMAV